MHFKQCLNILQNVPNKEAKRYHELEAKACVNALLSACVFGL